MLKASDILNTKSHYILLTKTSKHKNIMIM